MRFRFDDADLGDIIVCGIALMVVVFLFIITERRRAAVGRREMEVVLVGYFLICVCDIFSLGGFLTNKTAVQVCPFDLNLTSSGSLQYRSGSSPQRYGS